MKLARSDHKLYTASQVRLLDQALADARGVPTWQLMQDAGAAAFNVLRANWPEAKRIIILTGSGNNAGDGWVLASLLKQAGVDVFVIALKPPEALQGDAAQAVQAAQQAGCVWFAWQNGDTRLTENLEGADVVVDGLLGTGIQGELRGDYPAAIMAINQSGKPVLALDVPSGLYADTGAVGNGCVQADITVTFVAHKRGQMTLDGPDYCGRLVLADLGLGDYPEVAAEAVSGPVVDCLVAPARQDLLPPRLGNSHKKTYGHVVVIGGNRGMAGAGLLAAKAALRCGAGLVTLVTHNAHASNLHAACPELMISGVDENDELPLEILQRADCVIIGPGLGQDQWAKQIWHSLDKYLQQREGGQTLPVVVDADGLYYLADQPLLSNCALALTPHPGEAAALLGIANPQVQQDRFGSAGELAGKFNAVAILKGNGSIVAGPNQQLALSPYGNPGMATAGMGDVLAGVCGGLLAQAPGQVFQQVCRAVTVHALAGDHAARRGQAGLLAGDVIDALVDVLP